MEPRSLLSEGPGQSPGFLPSGRAGQGQLGALSCEASLSWSLWVLQEGKQHLHRGFPLSEVHEPSMEDGFGVTVCGVQQY